MNRRQFLAGLSGLTMTHCVFEGHAATQPYDVIIVGAGMAGLATAIALQAEGASVLIVEARERCGGRVWTDQALGFPCDLGASWIHGSRNNPITALAGDFGVKTLKTDYENASVHDRGKRISDRQLVRWYRDYEGLLADAAEIAEDSDQDISVGAALQRALKGERLSKDEARALNYFLSGIVTTAGADLSELSAWYLDSDQAFGGADRLFPDGYGQLVARLSAGLAILTETEVRKIANDGKHLRLETTQQTLRAEQVVVTVPLGVLKANRIDFSQLLSPAKQQAIGDLGFGLLNKVVLKFPEVVWDQRIEFIDRFSDQVSQWSTFMNLVPVVQQPALMAFCGGAFARQMESRSDGQLRDEAVSVLREIYPGIPDPTAMLVSRWASDPYAGGSYSHLPPGQDGSAYDVMAQAEAGGRLRFAGEATIRDYPATVHGAWLSGQREAEQMLG